MLRGSWSNRITAASAVSGSPRKSSTWRRDWRAHSMPKRLPISASTSVIHQSALLGGAPGEGPWLNQKSSTSRAQAFGGLEGVRSGSDEGPCPGPVEGSRRGAADGQALDQQGRLADPGRIDWPDLPQMPTPSSSAMSLPIAATLVSTVGPSPIRVAPLIGAPNLPSSIR